MASGQPPDLHQCGDNWNRNSGGEVFRPGVRAQEELFLLYLEADPAKRRQSTSLSRRDAISSASWPDDVFYLSKMGVSRTNEFGE